MKKIIFVISLLALIVPVFAKTSGIMLRNDGPLREDKGNDGVEWSITVPAGTILEIEDETPVIKNLITSKETTPDVKFYKVSYQKKTYFAMVSEVALASELSVILEDTTMFLKPSLDSFVNAQIEKLSWVAVGKSINANNVNYREIQYWSDSAWAVRTRYVLSDAVSNNPNDVKAVQILDKIAALKDEEMKKTLIESAKDLSTSISINEEIEDTYNAIYGVNLELLNTVYEFDDFQGWIDTKDGAKLNVREFPGTKCKVLGQIADQSPVKIYKVTEELSEIDGETAAWYYIKGDSIEGWVFGAYVLEAE